MNPRAARLITALDLSPHPEGGVFREIHRSTARVEPLDGRGERAGLTTIYFLLVSGEASRWHRVASDEAWHFLEGDALELHQADARLESMTTRILGPWGPEAEPARVVPAGSWQVARTTGDYTLVGCTVGPGFDFRDFVLLRDLPVEAEGLRRRRGAMASYL